MKTLSVQFYAHSDYSLLESVLTVEKLVAQASKLGIQSMALTDKHSCAGHQEFEYYSRQAGIKPIFGLEIDLTWQGKSDVSSLVLVAMNQAGYTNLLKLASQNVPLAWNQLPQYKRGLALLAGGSNGRITHLLHTGKREEAHRLQAWYQKHFGEHYYLRQELGQDYDLLEAFPEQNFIFCQDVRYTQNDEREALKVLSTMKDGAVILPEYPLLAWCELKKHFALPEEKFEATKALAERCNVQLLREEVLPAYPGRLDLKELAKRGAENIYGQLTPEIEERLAFELAIIEEFKFSDYFLIVADIVRFAKEAKIPVGPARGSAASSLVSFCLGITEVDPLAYGLLFERFLNPERQTMPDIDLDFCYERRGEVLAYVAERFGEHYVAQIATYGTFGKRSAEQEVERVLGKADQSIVRSLQGLKRHRSTHAAGVIVTDRPVQNYTAIYQDRDLPVTHLDMYSLENLGILKIDLLGLRTLTILEEMETRIQKSNPTFFLEQVPLEDEKTWNLLAQGRSLGIFQLESSLFQDLLRRLKPASFLDLVALLALGRPGPLRMFPEYLKRRENPDQIEYASPEVKEILAETYGLLLYQEQVMLIGKKLAGLSLGEADLLRIALGKNDQQAIQTWRTVFMRGCQEKGKISQSEAARVFAMLTKFSGYAFNKAHSVSYAILSWRAAYLKAHFPREFYLVLLNTSGGQEQRNYLLDAQALGINLLPPSVVYSKEQTCLEGNDLRLGLLSSRRISPQSARKIVTGRRKQPWQNFAQFRHDVQLDQTSLETLILLGACDDLGERSQLLRELGVESLPARKLLEQERELLGIYLSQHPVTPFKPLLRNLQGELQMQTGQILEIKTQTSQCEGILDTPQGSLLFAGSLDLPTEQYAKGELISLFGSWQDSKQKSIWQVKRAFPLRPTLLLTPKAEDLATIKTIFQGEHGSYPVILRLADGSVYHLLPEEFWIRDLMQANTALLKYNLVHIWFDPWKERI